MRVTPTISRTLRASLSVAAALAALAVAPAMARAEEGGPMIIRNLNPSARNIGCTAFFEICPGVTDVRTGLVVVDVSPAVYRTKRYALIGMFQASAAPKNGLLASQMITGVGVRIPHGHSWLQAGAGIGANQTAPGPKTIKTTHALAIAQPAVMLGVGREIGRYHGGPVLMALDTGTTLDNGDSATHTYQMTASFSGSL